MTGSTPPGNDLDHNYDEFSFGQLCEVSYGRAGSATAGIDVDPVSWNTHPTAVDEPFQRQHHDSFNPLSSICYPGFQGPAVPFYGWENDEMAVFPDIFPPFSPSGILPSTEGSASPIDMRQSAAVPAISPATCKEVDEETLLKSLRDAGYGYAAISEAMREQLGIEITANALVKRYQKMPKTCESLLANAIANIMPQIMAQLYAELPQIDDGTLSAEEKQTVDRMLQDLPQVLPNCVRTSLSRKRRNMQPSSSL